MIQIEAIDHIHILAPSGAEAAIRRFYGDLLGLTEVEKPPELRPRGGAWFRAGQSPVLLHIGLEADPPPAGRRHFALRVADVAAARRYLDAQGVRTEEAPLVAGMPRFYAFDPWGNQIEIMNYAGAVLSPQPPSLAGKGESEGQDARPEGEGSGVARAESAWGVAFLTPQPPSLAGKGESRGSLATGGTRQEELTRPVEIGQPVPPALAQRAKQLRREMTREELILWQHLRAHRLNGLHFRRQHVIDRFIADFYCHTARLIVEVDGGIHDEQPEYDNARDLTLAARGLRLLRIRNDEIKKDLPGTLRRIIAAANIKATPSLFPASAQESAG